MALDNTKTITAVTYNGNEWAVGGGGGGHKLIISSVNIEDPGYQRSTILYSDGTLEIIDLRQMIFPKTFESVMAFYASNYSLTDESSLISGKVKKLEYGLFTSYTGPVSFRMVDKWLLLSEDCTFNISFPED